MSATEILAELPKLSAQERAEIMDRLWHLEEAANGAERHSRAQLARRAAPEGAGKPSER